ncbi:ABC transporter permease [Roseinatronobacter alkalisoli]|uniref:Spermidine/putrescine transport system permease protein PotC n=1 Tax=Roseinatronobacter alkalisoli TaxID=3028235 RepID=A0ABT5TD80_9RHOB|nr:ABC transporter permease [Roseinatronobacter sp. HJB301]MDD7972934.1 ABC transporter permease [Roseinatronobacter sp. HJB301]
MPSKVKSFNLRRMPGFTPIALAIFVILYAPIVSLVVYSFNSESSVGVWGGWSLRWYVSAWNNEAIQRATLNSIQIAIISGAAATVMALMAALAMTRTRPYRGLTTKYALLNQPLMVPEIVTGVALLIVFARIKVWTGYTGPAYIFLAHTAFCIPFAYLPIRARLIGMDLTYERAAADLYAPPWATFRYVTLPLLAPGALAGFLLAFAISLDNVVISEFVKSGGQDTLPTYMLGQLRRDMTPEVNAAATVLLVISILAVSVFFVFNRKKN